MRAMKARDGYHLIPGTARSRIRARFAPHLRRKPFDDLENLPEPFPGLFVLAGREVNHTQLCLFVCLMFGVKSGRGKQNATREKEEETTDRVWC